ncbi:MAG: hypothetical protein IIV45_18375 [Lachnospiraceae bacterium]|nr:hypothetical protein [Lachnospiraceae bacterium]
MFLFLHNAGRIRISFSLLGRKKEVISNVSSTLKKGKKVGLFKVMHKGNWLFDGPSFGAVVKEMDNA